MAYRAMPICLPLTVLDGKKIDDICVAFYFLFFLLLFISPFLFFESFLPH